MGAIRFVVCFLVALALSGALQLLDAGQPATAKCQPYRPDDGQTYHAGWRRPIGARVGGVYSKILNYSPWVHPNHPSVTAWSLLTASGLPGNNWLQIGWQETAYDVRYIFTQITLNGVSQPVRRYVPPPAVGTNSYYSVLYYDHTPQPYFRLEWDGQLVEWGSATFMPTEGQIAGEIHTYGSQMPGGTLNREVFSDSHIYTYGWAEFGGTNYVATPPFGIAGTGGLTRYIWDQQCNN